MILVAGLPLLGNWFMLTIIMRNVNSMLFSLMQTVCEVASHL